MRSRMLLLLCLGTVSLAQLDPMLLETARVTRAVEPTPVGDGHLGNLASGTPVQVRFSLPKELPLGFAVRLGNVVGFTGKGSSYQLVIRRDAADGEVIYEGPVIANGDEWNATNRPEIDLTAALTAEDARRGYLDLFLTGIVTGDGFTLYRSNDSRPVTALVAEDTPEQRAARQTLQAMRDRGLSIIPAPQRLALQPGELTLTANSGIVLAAKADQDDRFAASDLAETLLERTKLKLAVRSQAKPGDIRLERTSEQLSGGPEAYRLTVDTKGVRATASSAAGLFYAACTIGQLVRADGSLPCCVIDDWPAYPLRGLQYDVARGQTVNVEWWSRVIRMLARCKLNALMIYGENDYHFKQFPFLGRPDTFTPEKAKVLSDLARQYHVQLIPQFESLGHASAVLRADEMAPLREAGGSWVFCTSNPGTWEFLDRIYGELREQFPDAKYLHVGADEFEMGFGKCPECQAKVKQSGLGGLYAEHMNKLGELCGKHGFTMLFWPSHGGPTPELSYMTIKYQDQLKKDCIPTEWIYHGPSAYPQLEQYQQLGFEDVWASAAVVCFSRIWPDYRTTYRGIRGFLRAGHERGIKGAMTTTWEWMHGGVVANSLLGMVYSAECAWSLGQTPTADFERRYAQQCFGVDDPTGEAIHLTLADPWPGKEAQHALADQRRLSTAVFTPPDRLRRDFGLKQPQFVAAATEGITALDEALTRLAELQTAAKRNGDLLDYARLAFLMERNALRRLEVTSLGSHDYGQALKVADTNPAGAAAKLRGIADAIDSLKPELLACIKLYQQAVEQLGAYAGDVQRLQQVLDAHAAFNQKLRALADDLQAGKLKHLPPARQLGLETGSASELAQWTPEQMSEEKKELRFPLDAKLLASGTLQLEWEYTRGAHGLRIYAVRLLRDGEVVSQDEHEGWAGAGSHQNVYTLELDAVEPDAKYELAADVASSGGTDSHGTVWLLREE